MHSSRPPKYASTSTNKSSEINLDSPLPPGKHRKILNIFTASLSIRREQFVANEARSA
jgi:hypothetical protein